MKKVHIPDADLMTVDVGEGEPLLLVHGFPLDHSMWQSQIEHFSSSHRVIAPDLRGFGRSDVSPDVDGMGQYADDLAALLDSLGVSQPVTLCGLSMGGYVAWQFWLRHRDQLDKLILCDTRAIADTPEVQKTRKKMIDRVRDEGPGIIAHDMLPKLFAPATRESNSDVIDQTRQVVLATDREGIAAALAAMASRPDMTDRLPEIAVPTLLVCGEHDAISPSPEMREIAEHLPNARFTEVPDAGHMAPLENPQAVNRAIAEFLQG